jgi:hypothetical protein
MKRIGLPIVILAVLGAFLFWWFSPVQVVKRRTHTLLETLTMESGSGKVARQTGLYPLNALLAEEVELVAPSIPEADGTFGRDEMESAYSWLAGQAKQTRFKLLEIHSIKVEGRRADVSFSLEALVELPNSRPADGRYEVVFHWLDDERSWRLSKAEWNLRP